MGAVESVKAASADVAIPAGVAGRDVDVGTRTGTRPPPSYEEGGACESGRTIEALGMDLYRRKLRGLELLRTALFVKVGFAVLLMTDYSAC